MSAKHTPGPWTVDPKRRLRIFANDDQTVASAGGSDHVRGEWDANARLIAAAPDLLEALAQARQCLHDIATAKEGERWGWDWESVISDADAAIAKARDEA